VRDRRHRFARNYVRYKAIPGLVLIYAMAGLCVPFGLLWIAYVLKKCFGWN
jgi:hypothetical protein